jgi:hypothetical protein
LNPFSYPKVRHVRTQTPPFYPDYRQYKPWLRIEFSFACVYCRQSECGKPEGFGVEHYKPKSQFPQLEREYTNLFYSCNGCNSRKGSRWFSGASFIPNPCEHTMWEHLRFKDEVVEPRSSSGALAAKIFDLNAPGRVALRKATIDVATTYAAKRVEAQQKLKTLIVAKRRSKGAATYDGGIATLNAAIDDIDNVLRLLCGVPQPSP